MSAYAPPGGGDIPRCEPRCEPDRSLEFFKSERSWEPGRRAPITSACRPGLMALVEKKDELGAKGRIRCVSRSL